MSVAEGQMVAQVEERTGFGHQGEDLVVGPSTAEFSGAVMVLGV